MARSPIMIPSVYSLKFSLSKKTQILGGIRLAPYIAGYKLGWVTDKTIRTPKLCQVGYIGYDAASLICKGPRVC